MYMNVTNEKQFQRHIIDYLVQHNNYQERKSTVYNRAFAMDPELLMAFLRKTQPDAIKQLQKVYNGSTVDTICSCVNQMICQTSLIETLKNGLDISNVHLNLLYGKPATDFNPDLTAKYQSNIFSVMEEVWINDKQRIDLVVFVNGLAVMSFELKCEMSGQDYRDAVHQYSTERDFKNRLFLFKAGTLVNFAMDLNNCYMTTRLNGPSTQFLPFNRGCGTGVDSGSGNPLEDGVDDYATHYMWDDILTPESMIELLTKFVFIQRSEYLDEVTQKKKLKEDLIFPRYHQRDAVHKILEDVETNGSALNYLIQHSAGSGKTNTIAWLAHRLSSLHNAKNEIIFDNIVIVTDRVVVDRQLQNAVKTIDHKTGLVKTIGDKETSEDLAKALDGNTKIIVTTIQKFFYVNFFKLVKNLEKKHFAVIIDEAHSSTSGKDMSAVQKVLGSGDTSSILDAEDMIAHETSKNGKPENVSVFAFTATPKPTTLKLFGREQVTPNGLVEMRAFHQYSMKQAIEEGFILDVLQNYIEYQTYYTINKTIADDPKMKTDAAKRQIARFADLFDENINQRVNIIVEHFRTTVMSELGGQAKAMVITASREAAVRYRQAFEDYVTRHNYTDIKALVAFTGKVSIDDIEYTEPGMNGFSEEALPKQFDTGYNVLLVADKYQVGFDQPKLAAMYVMKKLKGVNAVQTLSRLNRPCPPYDKKVFILDFVNTCAEMEEAFAPYYTTTILSNTVSVAQLREMELKIDGYNVLDDQDIDTVNQIVFSQKKATAKDNHKIEQCMMRAITVLKKQYDEKAQKEFKLNCRAFCRLYTFLTLASSFGDPELHKKYVFVDLLLTHLITGNNGGIDIKDKINATNFVQKNMGDKGVKRNHSSSPVLKLPGAEVALTETEEKNLSEIIDDLNARAGKNFDGDLATKAMLQIKDLLLKSDKLKTSAKNNTEQDFEFALFDHTDDALIEGLSQNQELFTLLLNNEDLKHRVLGVFLADIYKTLKENPKP